MNNLLYEDGHYTIINDTDNNRFYYFDYDVRSADLNMEFQHLHSFYEIMILLSPSATHLIDGLPFNLQSGDIVCIPPSLMHKSVYYKGDPSKRIIIQFMYPTDEPANKAAYEQILSPFHSEVPVYRFDMDDNQRLVSVLNDIYRFSDSHDYYGNPADEFYIHNKFQEFLYNLYEIKDKNMYVNNQAYDAIEQKVYEIASHIHTHFNQNLSLESLAKDFYISPSYLSREFKRVTNFNLTTYIQMTRIKNAQYRLTSTNDKISIIAEDCGFTSFSQFNRIFNKIAGQSPRDYRNSTSSLEKDS